MLRISSQLSLPLDAVTRTFGLLAMRGAGKSNAAVVMAEQMYDAHIPWVAIDPKGDWWGIRGSKDGKKPGLEVPIFGGEHGDIPLEPTAGSLFARLVAEDRMTCVLDLSLFTKGEQTRFLLDFATTLFRLNREPMHLFLDEADEYIPQRVFKDMAPLVGAWSKLIKQGRNRGIGMTVVSQRSAVINKDVLTQLDNLIPMRTTSPQDRKAILAWVEHHALGRGIVEELPTLEDGEAWMWSPYWLKTAERIKFHQRRTFDSGATPELGKGRPSARLADIDLSKLQEDMADTIEKAEAADPRKLTARIRALEAELRKERARTAAPAEPTTVEVEVPVEVPVLSDEVLGRLEKMMAPAAAVLDEVALALAMHTDTVPLSATRTPRPPSRTPVRTEPAPKSPSRRSETVEVGTVDGDIKLGLAERKIIAVLLAHGERSKRQVAIQARYSIGGGGFNNALGKLRSLGIINTGEPIRLLAAPADFEPPEGFDVTTPPTGREMLDYWLNMTGPGKLGKAERMILQALYEHPDGLDKQTIASITEYEAGGGGFNNALGKLRTLELVEGGGRSDPINRLVPEFFE